MLGEWFGIELFQFMGSPISLGRVILFSIISFLSFIIFFVVKNRSFKILKHVDEVDSSKRKKFYRILLYIFIAIVLLIAIT